MTKQTLAELKESLDGKLGKNRQLFWDTFVKFMGARQSRREWESIRDSLFKKKHKKKLTLDVFTEFPDREGTANKMKRVAEDHGVVQVTQEAIDYNVVACEYLLKDIITRCIKVKAKSGELVKVPIGPHSDNQYHLIQPLNDPNLITSRDLITALEFDNLKEVNHIEKIVDWDI